MYSKALPDQWRKKFPTKISIMQGSKHYQDCCNATVDRLNKVKESANELYAAGHYTEAIPQYHAALADTDLEISHYDLGACALRTTLCSNIAQCHLKLNQYQECLDITLKGVIYAGYPEWTVQSSVVGKILFRRATAMKELGMVSLGVQTITAALRVDSNWFTLSHEEQIASSRTGKTPSKQHAQFLQLETQLQQLLLEQQKTAQEGKSEDKLVPCAVCGLETKPHFCGRCLKTSYCSAACQRTHWKGTHKKECKSAEPSKKLSLDRGASVRP